VESVDLLMNYDVGPFVKRIYNTPTQMIVAERDDLTLWDLEIRAFNQIPTTKKKLEVLPHTSHNDSLLGQIQGRDRGGFGDRLVRRNAEAPSPRHC
jgi:hypothetical protein